MQKLSIIVGVLVFGFILFLVRVPILQGIGSFLIVWQKGAVPCALSPVPCALCLLCVMPVRPLCVNHNFS